MIVRPRLTHIDLLLHSVVHDLEKLYDVRVTKLLHNRYLLSYFVLCHCKVVGERCLGRPGDRFLSQHAESVVLLVLALQRFDGLGT